MPIIIIETKIKCPIEICFDLARDIGLHCETVANTKERATEGKTSGLIDLGETVTFEAVHFGVRQRLTAKIVELNRPIRFVDKMISGAFKSMMHVHEFTSVIGGTLMKDTLIWTSPYGIFGTIADKMFLENYMKNFLQTRNSALKAIAETKHLQIVG